MDQQEVASAEGHADEVVILVHGLWTPAAVFLLHSRWLERLGYRTLRFGYHSVRATLSENAAELQICVAETNAESIHLVGHSLGGLIILDMLAQTSDPRLRRAVLLGTPCSDSYAARRLSSVWGLSTLLGQSTMEWLSRSPDATTLQRSTVEVGVLAGTRSVGLGRVLAGLPTPNDGLVTLAETRLPGAIDFIDLPLAHSEMLISRRCAAQIARFLASGRFMHAADPEKLPRIE
ncbi:alpha/beta fold hydrolase [Candidatus Accumulibacter vicinus]|uniref:Alpha/beta hydrolase family protein n=1 Tax=Candidatus Accumulibacter vicinus TaxID=2954382 RepID=A0A084Y377_9PROT|nr:alpha/beta fold hydrolase [Candidatus Accumulibacter vicinus]KFB69171.1 MAG: Alpha/beta hydrolase family protein [Candidatus Accumulibacter vicinus]